SEGPRPRSPRPWAPAAQAEGARRARRRGSGAVWGEGGSASSGPPSDGLLLAEHPRVIVASISTASPLYCDEESSAHVRARICACKGGFRPLLYSFST